MVNFKILLGGDLGVGFDFGFTYQLSPQTVLTGSVLDLGFIRYSSDVKNYTLIGAARNEGIEIRLPEDIGNINREFWQELVDDLEEQVPFDTNEDAFTALRPFKINAAIRHNWGERGFKNAGCDCDYTIQQRGNSLDYVNAVGAHLFLINRPVGPQTALTAFYQRRVGDFLAVKTTYTQINTLLPI